MLKKRRSPVFSLILSILTIIFGLLMVVSPNLFSNYLSIILGIGLIILGILIGLFIFISRYLLITSIFASIPALFLIIFGICFIVNESLISTLLPLVLFTYLLTSGISKILEAIKIKNFDKEWWLTLLFGILFIVLSIIIIIFRNETTKAIGVIAGVSFLVIGVLNFIDAILNLINYSSFRNNLINKNNSKKENIKEEETISYSNQNTFKFNENDVLEGEIVDEEDNRKN